MSVGKMGLLSECPVSQGFKYFADIAKEVEPPDDGIRTHTLFDDANVKAVVFGFGQGEQLSEHTSSAPVILHFLQGEASLTLAEEALEVRTGAWIHMAPNLRHSVTAKTPLVMLLLRLKS